MLIYVILPPKERRPPTSSVFLWRRTHILAECADLPDQRRNLGLQETFELTLPDDGNTTDLVSRFMYSPSKPPWNETWTDKLKRHLLTHYDKFARPAQHNGNTTVVNIHMTLRHVDLDELKAIMTVHAWVKMSWIDEKLKWNDSEWGGLRVLHIADHEIWQPDIVLYNSATGNTIDHYASTHCLVYRNGEVLWVPPTQFIVFCDLDLRLWPFDTQTCYLRLGSWTYDGEQVDLQTDEYGAEIRLMVSNSEWDVEKVTDGRNVKYYSCCPEPYIDVTYNVTLRRRSPAYSAIVITPATGMTAYQAPGPLSHCSHVGILPLDRVAGKLEVGRGDRADDSVSLLAASSSRRETHGERLHCHHHLYLPAFLLSEVASHGGTHPACCVVLQYQPVPGVYLHAGVCHRAQSLQEQTWSSSAVDCEERSHRLAGPCARTGTHHSAAVTVVPATVKRWRYNTNFNNADNWSLKRAPCPLDRAVFPPAFRRLGVLLPEGTTELRQLVLPSDGELILPSKGQIIFGEHSLGRKTNCTRGENVFTRTNLKAWLDPESWIPEADDSLAATPHLERVPCRHDVAVFPGDASIGVRLPQLPVSVSELRFGSNSLTTDEWWEMLRSPGGWRFLAGPEVLREKVVELTMAGCTDPAGCVCLPDQNLLHMMICSYARAKCEDDGRPPCYQPVIPHGHCCAICGSYLRLSVDRAIYTKDALEEHVLQLRRKEGADDKVVFHISRTHENQVQVVLVDRGPYTGDSVDFGNRLYDTLNNNINLGVVKLELFMAGSAMQADALSRQIGLVFGTLMATILVLGGIFLVFVVFRDRLPIGALDKQAFVFARFENVDTESEAVEVVARPAAPRYDEEYEEESMSKSFDNPMYGKSKAATVTHENPVYSELKRREDQPKDIVEAREMKEMGPHTSEDDQEDLVDIDIEERLQPVDL
ncbi:uncharacterized protein [Anabrus simplex]|uniref:uncharacterized protein n=1 Tax=Anabrus simplex TaxID=316456 RepID=UPI0035A265AC